MVYVDLYNIYYVFVFASTSMIVSCVFAIFCCGSDKTLDFPFVTARGQSSLPAVWSALRSLSAHTGQCGALVQIAAL